MSIPRIKSITHPVLLVAKLGRIWLLLCLLIPTPQFYSWARSCPTDDLILTPEAFITTWKTDNPGSSNNTSITIPTFGIGYNYEVDWNNDGIYDQIGITGNVTHDFGAPGVYTIRIRGAFPRIYFHDVGDSQKLLDIRQWGTIIWTSMFRAFDGCANLNISASDVPNLSSVTDMSQMFARCRNLNSPANIGNWNTANVTNMSGMFRDASIFNQPIGNWNTANVTDMNYMFYYTSAFNQPIGDWNTGNVTDMSGMFWDNTAFNQPIGNWNTANVTDMSSVFSGTTVFNQPIGNWNTANVTDMSFMFSSADAFNQPIDNWNTANVTNMFAMFQLAYAFNQPIDNWNTVSVTNMGHMFWSAAAFNQPIGNWNTANMTNMSSMFENAAAFNQPLGTWVLNEELYMNDMLNNCGMDCENYSATLAGWSTNQATPNGRNLGAAGMTYQPASAAVRAYLTENKGWIIIGDAATANIFYTDSDGDGYGTGIYACAAPSGYVDNNTDCNDNDAGIKPTATEVCDGIDNDCNGLIDGDDPNLLDNTPPTITCVNTTITFNGEPSIALNPAALASASDNCGVPDITLSPNAVTAQQIGQTVPVTVTATDISGNPATCTAQISVGGLPAGWSQHPDGIGCPGGNNITYHSAAQVWTAISTNCYSAPPFTTDAAGFAQSTLCGNGSIVAQVSSLNGQGWAGIALRESNAPGARKVQLLTNLSNFSRREVRSTPGGQAYPQQFASQNKYWLRILRYGSQFVGYVSNDGASWTQAFAVTITGMPNCLQAGLVVTNGQANSTVTATFANVSVTSNASLSALETEELGSEMLNFKLDLNIFPNPTSAEVTVDITPWVGQSALLEVYDLQGRRVYRLEVPEATGPMPVNLSQLPAGVYLFRVGDAQQRVVLQR